MSPRSTIIYAVSFLLAMGAAYASWTHEPEGAVDEGVVLLNVKPEELARVEYSGEDFRATLELQEDERGRFAWVETERQTPKRRAPDPHDPHGHGDPHDHEDPHGHDEADPAAATEGEGEGDEPDVETTTASFKAGTAGDQLVEDLAPFRVVRRLEVPADRLAEFGFGDPETPPSKLTLTAVDGRSLELEVGSSGYGRRNVYVRNAEDGQIYVAKKTVVDPLERADTRLPDKRLFGFERADVERVTIATGELSLPLVQRNREDAAAARWTGPDSDEPRESAQNWLDKVFRLRATEYVPEAGKTLDLAFSVKFSPEDDEPLVLQVFRGAGDDGEPAFFAKSEFTRGLVKLSAPIATDIVEDLATLE